MSKIMESDMDHEDTVLNTALEDMQYADGGDMTWDDVQKQYEWYMNTVTSAYKSGIKFRDFIETVEPGLRDTPEKVYNFRIIWIALETADRAK